MMNEKYEFNAPTYVDLEASDNEDENYDIWQHNAVGSARINVASDIPLDWIENLRQNSALGLEFGSTLPPSTPADKKLSGCNENEDTSNVVHKTDVRKETDDVRPVHGSSSQDLDDIVDEEVLDEYIPVGVDGGATGDHGLDYQDVFSEPPMFDSESLVSEADLEPQYHDLESFQTLQNRKGTPCGRLLKSAATPRRVMNTRIEVNQRQADACPQAESRRSSRNDSPDSVLVDRHLNRYQPAKKPLTDPKTPFLYTSLRAKKMALPTSQEIEEEKIERQKKIYEAQRSQTNRYKEVAKQGVPNGNVKKLPLTDPKSPYLASSKRPGAIEKVVGPAPEKDVPLKRPTATGSGPLRLTVPEPFKITQGTHATDKDVRKSFIPVAQQVLAYNLKTPRRFHTKPKGEGPSLPTPRRSILTEPVEPKFASDSRLRKTQYSSIEEREQAEMNKMKTFKARPVPEKLFRSAGHIGVPKVTKKKPTNPVGFVSHTERRAQSSRRDSFSSAGGSVHTYTSHCSQGIDRGRAGSVCSRSSRKPLKLTEVKPFTFITDRRSEMRRSSIDLTAKQEKKPKKFVARKVPDFSKTQHLPQVEKKPATKFREFKLPGDQIHQKAQETMKSKAYQEAVEVCKMRQFRAKPIFKPNPSRNSRIPTPQPLTNPKTPLALRRSIDSKAQQQLKKEQAELEAKRAQKFRATPVPPSTYSRGFTPACNHSSTQPLPVTLASDNRATKRASFNLSVKKKLEEEKEKERERIKEKERKEKAELAKFRQSFAFKARPVPDYSKLRGSVPGGLQSPPPLTQPESPFLQTKKRWENRVVS